MIIILDLGSRENSYFARMIRRFGEYSEIFPHDAALNEIRGAGDVCGVIINGGPHNIVDGKKIDVRPEIYESGIKILSIDNPAPDFIERVSLPDSETERENMIRDFIFNKCGAKPDWDMKKFVEKKVDEIKIQTGGAKVLTALSGGVDASVVTALLTRAIGRNVYCIHVNHGLMRKNESERVCETFRERLGDNFIYVDACERFLSKLAGVADPETKRKIIGEEFINVFEEEARKITGVEYLAQGTIYPDIIESGTKTQKAVKSHHNVGGLPEKMNLKLIEPVRQLFKDEVRACARELGLPEEIANRQPFPGPGLGVRVLGAITEERLNIARESDAILREEFERAGLKIWQYLTVVPDCKSVGVKNDERTYEYPVIIRAVNSVDTATATVPRVNWDVLERVAGRILSEVDGANRVCYDLTVKPPGTIEWE